MSVIDHFADRLIARCSDTGSPICIGLDPVYERLPAVLRTEANGHGMVSAQEAVEAIRAFSLEVLRIAARHVPCVKIQAACFERYLWLGFQAYHELVQEARKLNLLVIGDAKRGDISASSDHYAAGLLGDTRYAELGHLAGVDALTVNGYLGIDGIEPFIRLAAQEGKGLFVLVRTSNPGGDAVQSLTLQDGRTVAEAVAQLVQAAGSDHRYVGCRGYSLLGAVVGATKSRDVMRLRELMPQQIFLVPGFGAQGGTADDVRACFRAGGTGAIITASRSILYAFEKTDSRDWTAAIEESTVGMKKQIALLLESK